MDSESQDNPIICKVATTGANFDPTAETNAMPAEDRRRQVLEFLVDTGLALPRVVIFRNMRYRGATFSESSIKNYLKHLNEEGYIERVDAEKLEDRELEPSTKQAGYYVPTKKGIDRVKDTSENSEPVLE